jgi:hypothetical protein
VIRHVVLFKLRPDVPADAKEALLENARSMAKEIDVLRAFSVGEDVVRGERSFDIALVADFDSSEDAKVYAVHPAHVPVAEMGRSLCAQVATVDFEI